MTPYLLITIAAVTGAYLSAHHQAPERSTQGRFERLRDRFRRSSWTYYDLGVVSLLIAFSGLRYQVGTDYGVYWAIFERVEARDLSRLVSAPLEVGYTGLIVALKLFTDSPLAFFWAAAALTVVPAYAAMKKLSTNLPLAVALYVLMAFYFAPMNIVRQGIAMSLVFWASTHLGASWRRFALVSALAVTFHTSAVFAAVACAILYLWKPSPRRVVLLVAVATPLVIVLLRLAIVAELLSALNPRYGDYVQGAGTGWGAYLMLTANVALLAYTMRVVSSTSTNPAVEGWAFGMILIGIALMAIGTQQVIVSRMSMYFTTYLVVLVPNRVKASVHAPVHTAIIGAGSVIYAYMYLRHYGGLLDYQTYL